MTAPQEWLAGPLTTLAFCWRLDRRDGMTLGFTSHDQDLMRDGILYRATPGMVPSAIECTDALDADSAEIKGALTSAAIRADDLTAGRWDGARLRLFATDWNDPDAQPVPLTRGELGGVSQSGAAFSAELRGPTAALDAPIVEETSPYCRASLGDARCGIDMAGRRRIVSVVDATDAELSVAPLLDPGAYAYGELLWIDGENAGQTAIIQTNDAQTVTLAEPPRFSPLSGDRVELIEGCDRTFGTCIARFGNALNFQGEPHLPGNDLLTRYGG